MDELVRDVACYNSRPVLLHGYLAPFFVLQASVYYYFYLGSLAESQQLEGKLASDDSQQNTTSPNGPLGEETFDRHTYEIAVIAIVVSVLAQAVTFLFCHWSIDMKCLLTCSRSKDPYKSKFVKVTPTPNNGSKELVLLKRETHDKQLVLSFEFQKTKYVYDDKLATFVAIEFPYVNQLSYYKNWTGYRGSDDVKAISRQYGRNELEMVIPEFKELFIERATAPFFVFQTFCVGLWCLDEFWYYALFTLFMLVTFEVVLVKHQLRNMQEIRRMGNKPFMTQVYREGKWEPCMSNFLVPGDIVCTVRSEHSIPCDILLVRGSCIIDESTLTGESVPQMKEPIEDLDDDDRLLDINRDKLHILFGGTKVLQHTASGKDPGCVGYVLKTGFHTSQGKLLRTILFGVKRVTANNFETFCFIMFLLFFAVISAYYVWTEGVKDPKRSRYRLFFECTVIITSVVPPELPIELSLAVNSSLISLQKLAIFCTEPFRIPFAGKVEYCCFDKTGTLTSDDLIVEGVAGLPKSDEQQESVNDENSEITESNQLAKHELVTPISQCPTFTQQVLASCHSLTHLDDKLVGDPLEQRVLEAINWNYSKSGTVAPKKGRMSPLRIHQRFHFNSTLKRMAVIASYKMDLSNENIYICTAKGAPEFMRPLMKNLPEDYDQLYLAMSRFGARVLALGYKTLGQINNQDLSKLTRDEVEKDLIFAGFLLISCPLKPDSKAVSTELEQSGHRLVMITGDGALTACHVASVLGFMKKQIFVLEKSVPKTSVKKTVRFEDYQWVSTDGLSDIPFSEVCAYPFTEFSRKHDLCVTGDTLDFILNEQKEISAYDVICRVKVFARVSPKQKEIIITTLKSKGKSVLMCGDGTNDVGALKHAHVGVALLSSSAPAPQTRQQQIQQQQSHQAQIQKLMKGADASYRNQIELSASKKMSKNSKNTRPPSTGGVVASAQRPLTVEERRREKILEAQAKLKEILEEQDRAQFVKLGDASIAAPFTSRLSSTQCISHIIKQGRCTLVTTLQMFKILALNALLSAYCHSVLYLDGIKFSDSQVTIQGLLSTFCFLFITRSQPLKKLSSWRPLPNIFNIYTIMTVTLQFVVHCSSLIFLYSQAKLFQESLDKANNSTLSIPGEADNLVTTTVASMADDSSGAQINSTDPSSVDSILHTEFKASLVNSTVYVIWMSVQLATFIVNYKGHPFMQDLRSNRPLCYSFIGTAVIVFSCVNGWSPGLSEQLSIVEFPNEFRPVVLSIVVGNFLLTYFIDRICERLFGRLKLAPL